MPHLTLEQELVFREVFDFLDTEQTGRISAHEFLTAMSGRKAGAHDDEETRLRLEASALTGVSYDAEDVAQNVMGREQRRFQFHVATDRRAADGAGGADGGAAQKARKQGTGDDAATRTRG